MSGISTSHPIALVNSKGNSGLSVETYASEFDCVMRLCDAAAQQRSHRH